jgi:hypothetical protein
MRRYSKQSLHIRLKSKQPPPTKVLPRVISTADELLRAFGPSAWYRKQSTSAALLLVQDLGVICVLAAHVDPQVLQVFGLEHLLIAGIVPAAFIAPY